MIMIELGPYLLTRAGADRLIDQLGDVAGQRVVLDCRAVSHAEDEFADQLVARLFEEKRVAEVGAACGHTQLWQGIQRALARRGIAPERVFGIPFRDLYDDGLQLVS